MPTTRWAAMLHALLRCQGALDTCHRSSAAASAAGVGLSQGGLRCGLELACPNDSALLLSDEKLLDDVLNQHEYWDLAEAIDANMAREDQIMILFDYAIFMLLDELQLAQVVVSSWPFFPLMGSICTWLLEGDRGRVACDVSQSGE
ncbi:hypothetical protein COO60DRAFT_1235229 [Scenedesmus sp. NREL 46B-D3]|nr:hypothetical protein COO60DRAFT_1235229 [Scenedesmus sp. NREL 46B-D3]